MTTRGDAYAALEKRLGVLTENTSHLPASTFTNLHLQTAVADVVRVAYDLAALCRRQEAELEAYKGTVQELSARVGELERDGATKRRKLV